MPLKKIAGYFLIVGVLIYAGIVRDMRPPTLWLEFAAVFVGILLTVYDDLKGGRDEQ